MAKANPTYLSKEDIHTYQLALVDFLKTRNNSASDKAARKFVEARHEARTQFNDDSNWNPSGLEEQIEREFYLAGCELICALIREVTK